MPKAINNGVVALPIRADRSFFVQKNVQKIFPKKVKDSRRETFTFLARRPILGRCIGRFLNQFAKILKNACQNTDIMVSNLGSFCRRMIQIYTGMVSKNTDFEQNL